MFKEKKLIIFDMDGTLIDSVGMWNDIDIEVIKRIGGTIGDENIQIQRDTTLKLYNDSKDMYFEYCKFLSEKYNKNVSAQEVFDLRNTVASEYNIHVEYKENAVNVLKLLREKGFKIAIGTTTRKCNIDTYNDRNQNMINEGRIKELVDFIIAKEDVIKRKPDPEVHNRILEHFNLTPEECLVVEDSLLGVEAAQNAKIDVVTIYDKYSDEDRSKINEIANYCFKDFLEMIEYIKKEL